MNDPLIESFEQGREAGVRIIEDFIQASSSDYSDAVQIAVSAMRTAGMNDTKYNYHLLETIMAMAARGLSAP